MKIRNKSIILIILLAALLLYWYSALKSSSNESSPPFENGDFSLVSAGVSGIPDHWVLGGAGTGTVHKELSVSRAGRPSIRITQTSGDFIALYQDIQNIDKYGNRKYSFGCWVNTTNPGAVRLVMGDSNGAVFSKYHSGSRKWEYLTLTGFLPANAKYLRAHIWVVNNATAYIEEAAVNFARPNRFFYAPLLAILLLLVILYLEVPFIRKHTLAVASKLSLSNKEIPYLKMQRMPLGFALILIMLLAFMIRFIGLHWGIPTAQIPHALLQCDEQHSMSATSHVDFNPQHIDLNTQNGHIEGSFSFYIYNVVAAGLKGAGIISKMPHNFKGIDDDYSTFLYAGRIVSIFSDLLSILVIFLILRKIARNDLAALTGAFLFAIIPFEAIHAHYMRTHTISNLIIVVMIYISLYIYQRNDLKLYVLLGLVAGVATATRYPTGIIITMPVMMFMYRNIFLQSEKLSYSLNSVEKLYASAVDFRIFLVVIFWLVGFFIADPTLFLNFNDARSWLAVVKQNTAANEFSFQNLFNLTRMKDYIFYLIPYGTFPFLWVIFYLSFVGVLFIKKYYQYTIPLCLFAFLYLYPMAKGYSEPIFIRAVMPLFPIFSILSAIAVTFFLYAFKERKVFYYSCIASISLVCISSIVYVFAYSIAMSKEDPRIQLYHYFNNSKIKKELVIGITNWTLNGFLTQATLSVLPNQSVLPDKSVTFIKGDDFVDSKINLDYVLLYSNFWNEDNAAVKATELKLTNSNQYVLDKIFENRFFVFGVDITYLNFFRDPPPDLQFPFPKLYLFKKREI